MKKGQKKRRSVILRRILAFLLAIVLVHSQIIPAVFAADTNYSQESNTEEKTVVDGAETVLPMSEDAISESSEPIQSGEQQTEDKTSEDTTVESSEPIQSEEQQTTGEATEETVNIADAVVPVTVNYYLPKSQNLQVDAPESYTEGEAQEEAKSAVIEQALGDETTQKLIEQQKEKGIESNTQELTASAVSEEEYDSYYFQYQSQQNELASLIQSQISTWQADLNSYRNQCNEMSTTLKQEQKDKDMYIVRSPVAGTVDQFSGIYKGSSIQAGQSLAVISPDSTLCTEVYVAPRNIGFMSIGMPVHVQVESFNYNEWGTLPGKVKDISSDFLTDAQGNSFYKVKCEMERDYLKRKNGRIGRLKKGMTVSAHFMVTRRSLFDLLYQKMDDWANPRQYESENMMARNN